MKNVILIIAGALAGVILFQFLFYSCEKKKLNKEIAVCKQQINDCLTAPVKVDTVTIENVLKDTIYLTYKYKVTDTVHVSDAIDWINQTVEQRTYAGIYTHPQFEVHWSALVTGTLDKMTMDPPSLIKSLIITKEKTVDLTKYQECPKVEKSHLYANLNTTFTFKDIQGISVDLAYIRKGGFGIQAGIGTNFTGINYNAGLFIRLK
jgi:hypothetical protein